MAEGEPATTHAFPDRRPLPVGPTEVMAGPAAAAPPDEAVARRREAQVPAATRPPSTRPSRPHAEVVLERRGTLGEGGMGIVERVHDRRLGGEAALELMRDPLADPALVRRFRREAEITARLDHPSIPPVDEAGTDGRGRHDLLRRVIEGEPLTAMIRRLHGPRDPGAARAEQGPRLKELLEALVKVGEAVAYAHPAAWSTATSGRTT